MKKILGLDLGTTSIGWALVNEAENDDEQSAIIKLGVRVNPLSTDEQTDFEKGKPLSTNADRTSKRGARRNLQRFKLRRKSLIEILVAKDFITENTFLTEVGKETTHQTLALRAKAAKERIEKNEFARVLLSINKKRGYKSSRKVKNEEEGSLIDGMSVAKELCEKNLTVSQYVCELLKNEGKYIPEFYRSDLQSEFDKVWGFQKQFYPAILTDRLCKNLEGKNKTQTWGLCKEPFKIEGLKRKTKGLELKKENYKWRAKGVTEQLDLETLAIVLQEINNNLNKSSGYLGAISDRSKELSFNKETVGENLYRQIKEDKHTSLKNQVFYRQDYLDEFEQIWETQAKYHSELTTDLKAEIRDVIIFYQRKLKSQKHLISNCEFEKHHKAIPKSSPLFQEFKIWQILNNLEFEQKRTKEIHFLNEQDKKLLFDELNLRGNLKESEVLKMLQLDKALWKTNYKNGIEGNKTNQVLFNIYQKILENEGYGFDWVKKSAKEIKEETKVVFEDIGIDSKVLELNSDISGNDFDKQVSYQLWHVLYSAEDDHKISDEDKSIYGISDVALKKKLDTKYGFKPEHAKMLANATFLQDHGSLSARAIKKILPFLKEGHEFSEACALAGYNHSHSLTKEELENRPLKKVIKLLRKNSLRNPVVEKILNQMVNVVNELIATYGKIDEVRIELARELKKSTKERADTTQYITSAKARHEDIRKILQKDFAIKNPTRNDVIRYKLFEELSDDGYKSLFTNQYIDKAQLFSKEIDIEHIIPKAKLFDDSFSNKTLAFRSVNLEKSDTTAFDFISDKHLDDLENYKKRVESLYKAKKISKGKYKKLLMSEKDLPDGFIDRDLRNSQYIAKKAKQMLQEVFRTVNTTTGSITDKLREDWDLIGVMKELNLPKYRELGLTEWQERKEGKKIEQIINWTKRNDHRHHAMDALTVAFTTHSHVQYLNHLNASRSEENSELYGIRNKITKNYEYKNGRKKRKFIPPMPSFREELKRHIESILISFKTKNKVVTNNKNKTKLKGTDNYNEKIQRTPRGPLHKETVYGKLNKSVITLERVNAKFDKVKIEQVTKPSYREALLKRLEEFNNNAKKAFTGKNALAKNPIYLSKTKVLPEVVKTQSDKANYTIRKQVNPVNFKDSKSLEKIIDKGTREILENRLKEFKENPKEAFSNLSKNPIWLNKERGVSIKRVTISGVTTVESLHTKKDHLGNDVIDTNGNLQAVDFVSTGNNHHVAIYKDEKGNLQEEVVSFYKAVARANVGVSIIDKNLHAEKGWQFLFTMKQNEMFLFQSDDFNPNEIDLENEENSSLLSKHLYRVQKISTKNYWFRHHLETEVQNVKELKNIAYKNLGLSGIENIVKVRINHIGKIVKVGEY